jgi:hypothetical protein
MVMGVRGKIFADFSVDLVKHITKNLLFLPVVARSLILRAVVWWSTSVKLGIVAFNLDNPILVVEMEARSISHASFGW